MRRILFVLIIMVGGVIALGFYRGWFEITTGGSGGQHQITVNVDADKIKADEKRARDQLPVMGKSAAPAEPVKN